MVGERIQRRLAAVLAADVVGYSRLMGTDEAGTLAALKSHRTELIDPKIAAHNGRIVKLMGDGLLAEFASVVDAVLASVEIQRGMAKRNAEEPADQQLRFRIGINVGDVIVDENDIYGDGVNVAARLEPLADPGGICVSDAVFNYVKAKVELGFQDLGRQNVKNIAESVHAYRVLFASEDAGKLVGRTAPNRRLKRGTAVAASIALVVIATVAFVWLRPWAPGLEQASESNMAFPLPDKPSIAVLPFANMSGDPNEDYFAQGMTDDLITDLSKVSGLFVISRNSTFAYKDRSVKIQQVAEELGVRYVLEGSVRRVGDTVRINAQLIDALTGGHLWADRYDRNLEDIFSLQDEVVEEVVAALSVELEAGERSRLHRTYALSPKSYDLFLHARTSLPTLIDDDESVRNARLLFERVVEQAPDFPGGYAGLSLTYAIAVIRGFSRMPESEAQTALQLAEKATEIDAEFGLSMLAMANALLVAGRYEEAIYTVRRLVKAAPSDADARDQLGVFLTWAGNAEEAIEPLNAAIRLNPDIGSPYLIHLGLAQFTLGRFEEAVAAFDENAAQSGPIDDAGLAVWTTSYNELGQSDDAARILHRLIDRYPDVHIQSFWLLQMYARPEDRERITEMFQRAGIPQDRPYTR